MLLISYKTQPAQSPIIDPEALQALVSLNIATPQEREAFKKLQEEQGLVKKRRPRSPRKKAWQSPEKIFNRLKTSKYKNGYDLARQYLEHEARKLTNPSVSKKK